MAEPASMASIVTIAVVAQATRDSIASTKLTNVTLVRAKMLLLATIWAAITVVTARMAIRERIATNTLTGADKCRAKMAQNASKTPIPTNVSANTDGPGNSATLKWFPAKMRPEERMYH